MTLRERLCDPRILLRLGAAFLLLGNAGHFFLHPTAALWRTVDDVSIGILFGLAIGCLLLSLRSRGRLSGAS